MLWKYFDVVTLSDIFVALCYVLGGLAIGLMLERLLTYRRPKPVDNAVIRAADVIVRSLRGMPVLWLLLVGIYAALRSLAISASAVAVINKALLILGLFSVTMVAARIAGSFAGSYSRRAIGAERSVSIFTNAAKLSVYLIGLLMTLQSVGVSIAPILTALGVGGLAVALALQDTLSNLFAGLQIVAIRKVKIGQYIRLDSGQDGYVTDITWRYTEILAPSNNTILVPNAKLVNAIVTNYYAPTKQLAASLDFTVQFGTDLEQVQRVGSQVAKEVAQAIPGIIPGKEPSVSFGGFSDWGVRASIGFEVQEYNNQWPIKNELVKRLTARFDSEGIRFATQVVQPGSGKT